MQRYGKKLNKQIIVIVPIFMRNCFQQSCFNTPLVFSPILS